MVQSGIRQGLFITLVIAGIILITFPETPQHVLQSSSSKIVYTLRWQILLVLTVVAGVQLVGSMRFKTAAINPLDGNDVQIMCVCHQFLQNTLEQAVIGCLGQLALCTYLEKGLGKVIPCHVILFITGRALYYYGYTKNPLRRAPGFIMTALPNLVVCMSALGCLLYYGPSFEI